MAPSALFLYGGVTLLLFLCIESKPTKPLNSTVVATQCKTDGDCALGTVCIRVRVNDDREIGKCTPDNAKLRACRGKNFGRCPSYQSPTSPKGYLNLQCIFVNTTKKLNVKCCSSGSSTSSLKEDTKEEEVVVSTTNSPSSSKRALTDAKKEEDCFICFQDNGKYYAGEYKCIPLEQCSSEKQNYFKDESCDTKNTACSTGVGSYCNNQGTCAPRDADSPTSFKCYCYKGFDDLKCGKVVSNECEVDCGMGGTTSLKCQNGNCKCRSDWRGNQCLRCRDDLSCNSLENDGNTCDKDTGRCKCATGYEGFACNKPVATGSGSLEEDEDDCDISCGSKATCIGTTCHCINNSGNCTNADTCDTLCSTSNPKYLSLIVIGLAIISLFLQV